MPRLTQLRGHMLVYDVNMGHMEELLIFLLRNDCLILNIQNNTVNVTVITLLSLL